MGEIIPDRPPRARILERAHPLAARGLPGGLDPTPLESIKKIHWLVRSGASLVHCPLVMARHADVLRSFTSMHRAGVRMGMGTDTWPPDFWLNLQVGIMTARIADESMDTNCADYFTAATIGGATPSVAPISVACARSIGRSGGLGSLRSPPGAHSRSHPAPRAQWQSPRCTHGDRRRADGGRKRSNPWSGPGGVGNARPAAIRDRATASAVARSVGHPSIEELDRQPLPAVASQSPACHRECATAHFHAYSKNRIRAGQFRPDRWVFISLPVK